MKIITIKELLDAEVLCHEDKLGCHVYSACSSDMMSNVRTAEMMDMVCIVFIKGKGPTQEMIDLAEELGIVLMSTQKTMFDACGILYENGLRGKGENRS